MNIREKGKRSISIRILRIVAYVLLYSLNIVVYGMLDSYLLVLSLVIMTVLPIWSLGMVFYLRQRLTLGLVLGKREATAGEISKIIVTLSNPTFAMALHSRLHMELENLFYQNTGDFVLELPVLPRGITREKTRGEVVQEVPIHTEFSGLVGVKATQLEIEDLCGFITLKKTLYDKIGLTVYPRAGQYEELDSNDFLQGMTESEESKGKGNDFSEISNIREYIPGDRTKDIHWKLSAKKDLLMVKERVNLSGTELVLLLELGGLPQQAEQVLACGFHICTSMTKLNIPVTLTWYDEGEKDFIQYAVLRKEACKEAFKMLYHGKRRMGANANQTKLQMQLLKPEIKQYVYVQMKQGKVEVNVIENE